jgi:acyl-CoA thioester hydrolase
MLKHKAPIQIRFADTDMLGHVNNANFLTYMELARMSYFDEVVREAVDWSKEGVILAKAVIDYRIPILLTDQLHVHIGIDHISSKSFNFQYRFVITRNGEEITAAEGSTIMVCFDYQLQKSIIMPDEWKRRIELFEK